MTFRAGVLLLLILGVSSSCSIPVGQEESDRVAGSEKAVQALGKGISGRLRRVSERFLSRWRDDEG